ncbi:MAG TPA: hypothetical protein VMS43_16235 [Allosphingosinicella sp.]|nr:hypothetical protein [Allosphingosinicella sp.]
MIWMFVASLALSGADPGNADAWQMSTPPPPPGVECDSSWPRRELRDLPLTPETTQAQVVAAWGEPRSEGPAEEISSYHLTCYAQLWLSFEPSGRRRLTRAILFTDSFAWPQPTVILDSLAITKNRRCNQLRLGDGISGATIFRRWGPPDNVIGSGIARYIYAMADGGLGQVFFSERGRFVVSCG